MLRPEAGNADYLRSRLIRARVFLYKINSRTTPEARQAARDAAFEALMKRLEAPSIESVERKNAIDQAPS